MAISRLFSSWLVLLGIAFAFSWSSNQAQAEPPAWSGSPDTTLVLKTLPGMMRYDLNEVEAAPGAKVKLTLDNVDDLQHNLVLLKIDPEDKDGQKFAQGVFSLGAKAIEMGWVPRDDPRVIVASQLLDPKATEDLYFVAPEAPGDYPYVCTVPGHSLLMRGILRVRNQAPVLKELTYSIYEGNWDKLPDFSKLEPVKTGKLESGLIDLGVAKDRKGGFGVVFEGKFEIEKAEKFSFYLASDDGSRLIIDGEGIVDNDGVHPMGNPKEGKVDLQEGIHEIRVPYFEKSGQRGLSVAMKSKSLGWVDLSAQKANRKPQKAPPKPMLLTAAPGEAITHRAFLPNANPRAIGVGYPGRVNLAWDADVMNLAYLWRGGFMDVAGHWNGRGSGSKPAGFDQVKTGAGLPMQVLESLDEPWESDPKATIKYERDKADPQKEISYVAKHPDYRFKGYRLDQKRFPTFFYEYRDLEVSDRSESALIDESEALVRRVAVKGEAEENTYFRVANTGPLEVDESGWYDVGGQMKLKLEGAEPVIRDGGNGNKELLAAVKGGTELTLTYRWINPIGGRVGSGD